VRSCCVGSVGGRVLSGSVGLAEGVGLGVDELRVFGESVRLRDGNILNQSLWQLTSLACTVLKTTLGVLSTC
jgi:hypothetical protein